MHGAWEEIVDSRFENPVTSTDSGRALGLLASGAGHSSSLDIAEIACYILKAMHVNTFSLLRYLSRKKLFCCPPTITL
jgi:hypothetical protein